MPKRTKYTIVDPVERTFATRGKGCIAWTYDKEQAERQATMLPHGVVVDAAELARDPNGLLDRLAATKA